MYKPAVVHLVLLVRVLPSVEIVQAVSLHERYGALQNLERVDKDLNLVNLIQPLFRNLPSY